MKRQPTEWEKRFANDATDKGLIFKHTNSSYNSTSKQKKKPIKKLAEDLNRHFYKEDYIWPTGTWEKTQHH